MSESAILSPEEVSRRIVIGMGLVYDLFFEMNSLFRLIRKGLEDSELGIRVHGGKGYQLRRGQRKDVTAADRFLRTDMGLVATIGQSPDDEDADDDDDEAEEVSEEDDEPIDRAEVAITDDTQFLGVRAILYDPLARDKLAFIPVVIAGVFTSITRDERRRKAPETEFRTKRANLKKLVKHLRPGLPVGSSVDIRIPRYDINANVVALREVQLASLSSEADVQNFVAAVLHMIEGTKAV